MEDGGEISAKGESMSVSRFLRRVLVHGFVTLALLTVTPGMARADGTAEAAIRAWIGAIASGDKGTLAAVLAPEFQIMRSNGTGFDRAQYAGGGAARITSAPAITDVVATRHGELLVTRYTLAITETVDGRKVQHKAPRLTVFRRDGDRWLVVAHANFARIE